MSHEPKWVGWGRELQAIAQTGLHFSESEYDRERYRKILAISIEMFADCSGETPALIRGLFENQAGYATPKVDVRGVIFRDDKLLLVQERSDGLWTLPGGWADVNDSPSEAVEREIAEESGFQAKAERMLAIFDRAKHRHEPPFSFHVYKLFILCRLEGGEARIRQWKQRGSHSSAKARFPLCPFRGSLAIRSNFVLSPKKIVMAPADSIRADPIELKKK